jgi:hypothetical protein
MSTTADITDVEKDGQVATTALAVASETAGAMVAAGRGHQTTQPLEAPSASLAAWRPCPGG